MDSSVALVYAASGLEKFLGGTGTKTLKDSTVAQISATIYYQAQVMSKLTSNKNFQNKFSSVIFKQIQDDFGAYVDAKARTEPKTLHHVYEWKRTGNKNARLFELNKLSQDGLSFRLGYDFKLSKSLVPTSKGKHRHVFASKASMMESGMPVIIRPRSAERLVFEVNGSVVFMPKGVSVNVKRPGGAKVKNAFYIAYNRFFTGDLVNQSIKRSGFQRLLNSSLTKAMQLPGDIKKVKYSFSPNAIRSQADFAVNSAFGGLS